MHLQQHMESTLDIMSEVQPKSYQKKKKNMVDLLFHPFKILSSFIYGPLCWTAVISHGLQIHKHSH